MTRFSRIFKDNGIHLIFSKQMDVIERPQAVCSNRRCCDYT
ncbi:hypothetical protein [Legionella oakridgensis]|nr:hypothetical protein [Legionella oakridgensis]